MRNRSGTAIQIAPISSDVLSDQSSRHFSSSIVTQITAQPLQAPQGTLHD